MALPKVSKDLAIHFIYQAMDNLDAISALAPTLLDRDNLMDVAKEILQKDPSLKAYAMERALDVLLCQDTPVSDYTALEMEEIK